jgi:hypothetical protein
MENNSLGIKHLRSEAGSLHWNRLDDSQFKALIRIMDLLGEAIETLLSPSSPDKRGTQTASLPPWFDEYRDNRMVLLDGSRGTGKTSVMLSLIHCCEIQKSQFDSHWDECKCDCTHRESDNSSQRKNDCETSNEERVKKAELEKKLRRLRGRIIWLEPLDMEPLPGTANLLAAVLARIEDASNLMPNRLQKPMAAVIPAGFSNSAPAIWTPSKNFTAFKPMSHWPGMAILPRAARISILTSTLTKLIARKTSD